MPANRLIHSTSPYLLQHAHNPVDWYPWGEEALEKARREDKPIFLSLGYAACHWCHVMERESFENPAIAEVLNRHFVSIKVDREERPDLDETYMLATQLMTGRGGWPNSVWLLPDGRPWYAGTYFPPEDQMGRMGFKSLLLKLAEIWRQRRAEVEEQARVMTETIQQHAQGPGSAGGPPDAQTLIGHVLAHLQDTFDARQGGFGEAPKFPPHASLALLLDRQQEQPDSTQHQMLHGTLLALQRWAASTTTWAAAFIATPPTRHGWSPISRRCSTTTRSWRGSTPKPGGKTRTRPIARPRKPPWTGCGAR
jgi:uncharacterized protein YyaL (SSP411 family)